MQASAKIMDPWARTIFMLGVKTEDASLSGILKKPPERLTKSDLLEKRGLSISLIERPSSTTAIIAWRDSTHCCYGDQMWRVSHARTTGVCAMSGQPVLIGDAVYRPSRRTAPRNAHAMILASVLEGELVA
ncbi:MULTISPECIES: DUF3331 domain-containing protein [unclassified Caballeronia]|uniref:DUF3331 domain-containing protein n=1 Tax=unclassified Caballeronia TaxID=2646786 RepID=UPI00285554A9|nr:MULTISPECIES: DUF3331 domain-containing protein [unclassified Caballeronia]MDR5773620.1 DUF3331 domain-containing protein [Caballeronia sp. LZ002]MDR5849054.1 DUF3331 domain-containing protein [Caballeronia sp. LZ003]